MSKGKTGLVILTLLAVMFFLFVAVLFGSSTKRQAAVDRKAELDTKIDTITGEDASIYWIGELPGELERLSPVVNVISPDRISRDTVPVKSTSFDFIEYNELGQIIAKDTPVEQPGYMVIVMTGSPVISQEGAEALRDAITQNGVPVIAIGNDASELLGKILCYRRLRTGDGSSLYYCLGKGYKENPLSVDTVKNGGMEYAEALTDLITSALTDFGGEIGPSDSGTTESRETNNANGILWSPED